MAADIVSSIIESVGPIPAAFVLFLAIAALFVLLARVCDEGIAPSLEHAAEWFNMPKDVACVTFLALGSSAPEIFINCVSTAVHVNDTEGAQGISMGTIFGSAIIAFTIIPACCVFVSPGRFLTLELVPLLRDSGFYCVGLLSFILFSKDGFITWRECLAMLLFFIVYLISMRLLLRLYAPHVRERQVAPGNANDADVVAVDSESLSGITSASSRTETETMHSTLDKDSFEVQFSNGTKEDTESLVETMHPMSIETPTMEEAGAAESSSINCWEYFVPPFGIDAAGVKRRWRFLLFISILYVAFIAEGCLEVTIGIGFILNVPDHILGVILVALGAQIPDAVASISVAKKGEGPGAVANAIGSQVMNILVGLGLPFFVSSVVRDKAITVDFAQTESSGTALFVTILAFLLLACRRRMFKNCGAGNEETGDCPRRSAKVGLSRYDAMALLALYGGFILWEIGSNNIEGGVAPDSPET